MAWRENECPHFYNEVKRGDIIIVTEYSHMNTNLHFIGVADNLNKEKQCWSLINITKEKNDEIGKIIKTYPNDFPGRKSANPWGPYRSMMKLSDHPAELRVKSILYSFYKLNSMQNNIIHPYINLLRSTHNLILTGAPGTGKTYLARQIAEAMGAEVGFVQFHPSYDYTDFVEGLRPIQDDNGNVGFERKDGVFKEFCGHALQNLIDSQKNQAEIKKELSISDKINTFLLDAVDKKNIYNIATGNSFYVRGFTNKHIYVYISENVKVKDLTLSLSELQALLSSNEKIENGNDIKNFFNRKWRMQHDSYLLVLYNQIKNMKDVDNQSVVSETKKKNFVFIIDEINRGEISKIFGELFFSIDPGYRGEKGRVQTQYQNIVEDGDIFKKGFFVPENVYIIGTMNDIDRSVESMDFAFRRRFAFKEIKADENVGMLDNLAQKDEAIKRMKNLNAAIEKVDGLSSAYHIGASYFLKLNDYNGDFDKLWEYHLEGLLREYLRGTQDVDKEIEKLKTAYNDESDHNNGQPQQAN